jgi:hypothetical protein
MPFQSKFFASKTLSFRLPKLNQYTRPELLLQEVEEGQWPSSNRH